MRAAIALRDVVGEALDVLGVRVVPLHGDFDRRSILLPDRVEDLRVENGLAAVHVLDEALDAARVGEVLALAVALVEQLDLGAVVEKRQFADSLRQDLVVVLDAAEGFRRRHEMNFGAAPVRGAVSPLAVVARSPAVGFAVGGQPARMVAAGGEAGERQPAQHQGGSELVAGGGAAVPELSEPLITPAIRRPLDRDATAVGVSRTDGGKGEVAKHADGNA